MFCEPGIPMPITKETYLKMVSRWLSIIRYKECGTIIFYPKSDRLRRINQFMADLPVLKKNLPEFAKTKFLVLDPDIVHFDDEEELKQFILSQVKENISGDLKTVIKNLGSKYRLVFLVVPAESLFLERKEDYLANLALQQIYNPTISILLFSEIDLTHPQFFPLLTKYTCFCQNLEFIPLYKNPDINCFFKYNEAKWQIKLTKNQKKQIAINCQHYWLIKEAVRFLRDHQDEKIQKAFGGEVMQIKLKVLLNAFSESEREVFKKIVTNQPIILREEKHSLNYLMKMGFINRINDKFKLTIPVFREYLENNSFTDKFLIDTKGEIILNNICVSSFFSEKEKKILTLFIKKAGVILSRDDLAKILWGIDDYDSYSDWVIDQTISRLRKKISKLGLPPKIIKTIKKQGFCLPKESH